MSEALRLADKLELEWHNNALNYDTAIDSSIELRRLAPMEAELQQAREELAALRASLSKPVAWDVYVKEADKGYLIDSLDDQQYMDDATNHGAVATPLFAIKESK
jgi:hypothetical protein